MQYDTLKIRELCRLTQQEFAAKLGVTRELINKVERGRLHGSKKLSLRIQQFLSAQPEDISHEFLHTKNSQNTSIEQPYYLQRREQKKKPLMITAPLVHIKAQAGYVKNFEQIDGYIDTLEKYSLPPGVNGAGAVWSYFEVDGDSMEPTFSTGDILLASVLPQEDWKDIKNFSIYIILTADQLMVKRLYQKTEQEWILLSDNEKDYPQKPLLLSEVKQVWTFRRHIRAKVPPPHEFKITA